MRNIWRMGLAAAAAVALAMPAGAQVTFQTGNHPQPNEDNILFDVGVNGPANTVTGQVDHFSPMILVDFTSTGQLLTAPSSGQARVSGDNADVSTAMTINLQDPTGTFADFILNPINGSRGDLTVDATFVGTSSGTSSFTYTIANGNNFLTITADAGFELTKLVLTPASGVTYSDLRQPRISGVLIGGVPPTGGQVPEPGTWAMMAGMGVPLLGFVRRMRKS